MSEVTKKKVQISERLPSPSGVAMQVVTLAENPNASLRQITTAIQTDPALAGQMLKLVNAPINGIARKVGSVSTAVTLLGPQTVKSAALAFSLTANHRTGQCVGFDYDLYWSDALARGVAARHLAAKERTLAPDEAFTCGLLCQIGRLALACVFPSEYGLICGERDPFALCQSEREQFGLDHNDMSAQMIKSWGLPELHAAAIRYQDDPDIGGLKSGSRDHRLAQLLQAAGRMAALLLDQKADADVATQAADGPQLSGFTLECMLELIPKVRDDWIETGRLFSIKTVALASAASK